jgi:hypothetical protein
VYSLSQVLCGDAIAPAMRVATEPLKGDRQTNGNGRPYRNQHRTMTSCRYGDE